LAFTAIDSASYTGDMIVDTITITGEEVGQIISETAETFSTEVIRAYDATTQAFNEDLQSAEKEIRNAKQALQEAIDKLAEYSAEASKAANVVQTINDLDDSVGTVNGEPLTPVAGPLTLEASMFKSRIQAFNSKSEIKDYMVSGDEFSSAVSDADLIGLVTSDKDY
jgi:hypothetical protein